MRRSARSIITCLTAAAVLGTTTSAPALSQVSLPASAVESTVTLFCNNLPAMSEILAAFAKTNPLVKVNYVRLASAKQYDLVVSELPSRDHPADLVVSSSMDLQIKLGNDGYATHYESAETERVPDWFKWQDMAFGISKEPVVIVYNKTLVPPGDVPHTHADLTRLLTTQAERYRGKVATFDIEHSSTGLMFATQDVAETPRTWDLFRAMGQSGVKVYTVASTMLDRVAAGDQLIAYNVLGSYALKRAQSQPSLGVIIPADYALMMSRIAIIPKSAQNPAAAERLLDFILSKTGQAILSNHFLEPVREDVAVANETTAKTRFVPIRVGPTLLTYLDQAKREKFLREWRKSLQGG